MKHVKFEKISISNFKGIQSLEIVFNMGVTHIKGKNGTGKTTVIDAINWVLRGKDSKNRNNFNIKNTVNTDLNKAAHSVYLSIDVNGIKTELGKSLTEKWVRRRGKALEELDGTTTEYFIDGVSKSQAEFNNKVSEIFSEDLWHTLTNPYVFGSLEWKKQRSVLLDMAGGINNDRILQKMKAANPDHDYSELEKALSEGKSHEDYRQIIASKKTKVNDQKKTIKPRIEENLLNKPEPVDEKAINMAISSLESELRSNEDALTNIVDAEKEESEAVQRLIKEKHALEVEKLNKEAKHKLDYNKDLSEATANYQDLWNKLNSIESSITSKKILVDSYGRATAELEARIAQKIKEWTDINNLTFPEYSKPDLSGCNCKECGQTLPKDKISEMEAQHYNLYLQEKEKFEQKKISDKKTCEAEGNRLRADINNNKNMLEPTVGVLNGLEKEYQEIKAKLDEINPEALAESVVSYEERVMEDQVIADIVKRIEGVKFAISNRPNVGTTEQKESIKARISELRSQIKTEEQKLLVNDRIKDIEARDKELNDLNKSLAVEIAQLEKQEFYVQEFISTMVEDINQVVSDYFPNEISVILFHNHYNGSVSETCEITYGGVPFSSLNTASQVLTGVEIINVLSSYYNLCFPVMVDNKESTLIDLPVSGNQLILLSAIDTGSDKLVIE